MTNPNPNPIPKVPIADGAVLLDRVQAALARYVILPTAEAAIAVTLWIAATHAAPAWNTAARLVIRAPEKRCGKSRLLDVIEAMCHHPVMTVNASPSAIYRMIGAAHGDPPTILIDEADTIFGEHAGAHEDLRGLLNAGHQRGRPALRWDINTRSVEELETYAMAALAGIGRLPDTIEDRAVIIRMRRRAPNETVRPYRLRRDAPALKTLGDEVHHWVRSHHDRLIRAVPAMPLEDRAADTWEALIAIADQAGGPWPNDARHAAVTLTEEAEADSDDTLATRLLADIRAALDDRSMMRTEDLLAALKADLEAPWITHGTNGLTPRALSSILKDFGISSRVMRFGGTQSRGYAANDFHDAWNRYLPPPPETPVTPVMPSQPQVSDHADRDGPPDCDSKQPSHPHPKRPDLTVVPTDQIATTQCDDVTPPIRHNPPIRHANDHGQPGDVTA